MKKLQELVAERATKMEALNAIELSDETRSNFDELEAEIEVMDSDIKRLQKQEEMNKRIASINIIENKGDDEQPNFSRAMNEMFVNGHVSGDFRGIEGGLVIPKTLFRASPIITTTDTGIINKVVDPVIDIKKSFGEQYLRNLGVRFIEGLTGNLVLPAMAESQAVNPAETGDSSTADQTPSSITLSAKRVDHFQPYTREFLAQTSTYPSLLQDLVDGIGNKHLYNFFDNMNTDAVDASVAGTISGVTYSDIVGLEANLADIMGDVKYVGTPAMKAYLKQLNASSAGIKFVWTDQNEMIGIPAQSAGAVNVNNLWLGDWSKATFATFGTGGIEIIVDEVTLKKQGQVEVYAVQLADSGTANYRNFSWLNNDSSIG